MGEKYGVVGSGEIWEGIALCFDELITIKCGAIEEKIFHKYIQHCFAEENNRFGSDLFLFF